MPQPALCTTAPSFTAVLFGLSGCLVDFGARSASLLAGWHLTLIRQDGEPARPTEITPRELALCAQPTPGALAALHDLYEQRVPCAWLDELPDALAQRLTIHLPAWLTATAGGSLRAWPAPDTCWQALSALHTRHLEGCVLVSGEPRLLQAGLNAGLWTVGLAACGSLAGHTLSDWQALDNTARDHLRADATLTLYRLGAHSVIDQLSDLPFCLEDLQIRRSKGEKP